MRVQNPLLKNEKAHGPFPVVQFDRNGVSEEIPVDVGHYLCKFSGFRPYKGAVTQQLPQEPTQKATKAEILAFCTRYHIGGASEEMTKQQLLEHVHRAMLEKQGAGRMADQPPAPENRTVDETEEEELAEEVPDEEAEPEEAEE